MKERLQKMLARAGLGSRREIESWIEAGLIRVNGRVAHLGDQAGAGDRVQVRGQYVHLTAYQRPCVLVYHKPQGEITARKDPEGRPTVFARLPTLRTGRWIAIGRLDISTSGVLLFTNDGRLANKLMHPSAEVEREYAARVRGQVDAQMLARLRQGVVLEDGMARFETILEAGGGDTNRWFHVILREGRNREVKRLWESQGVSVSRLIRVRFGPVALDRCLRPGRWRRLKREEMRELYATAGLESKPGAHPTRATRKSNRHARRSSRWSQAD